MRKKKRNQIVTVLHQMDMTVVVKMKTLTDLHRYKRAFGLNI